MKKLKDNILFGILMMVCIILFPFLVILCAIDEDRETNYYRRNP